ncbi:MAG: lysoplasmalogenase, partial [Chloroflexota bacterium]|nr:lysoplasmalogenase [Chloroflexota bacterium]
WKTIKVFSKSLAMVLVILWTLIATGWQLNLVFCLLLLGQVFGLIGDILLQLPKRRFMLGLGAFLLGHLCYLIILVTQIRSNFRFGTIPQGWIWWMILNIVIFVGILAVFYRIFSPFSKRDYHKPVLWIAIQIYAGVLSLIVVLALLTVLCLPARSYLHCLLPIGSILFLISDFLLSYNRFIKPIPQGQLWVRITYHLAQFCLAGGFLAVIL